MPKKKLMKVITKHHRKWGDEEIPPINFEDLARYLGVEFQPDGNIRLPRALWILYLENLSKAHLNPIQKIEAIRQTLVSKIKYQLRLSGHGLEEARKMNWLIRKYVKKILHLPTWTSTSWIHHRNGCNIPDLVASTMITRINATLKMKTSTDAIVQQTGDVLTPLNEERLMRLNLDKSSNKGEEAMKKLENQIKTQNNGKALLTAMRSKHKRSWLWTKRGLKTGEKLQYIQALSPTLPTKVNNTRGCNDMNMKKCKRCRQNKIEDDAHILAACDQNKDEITKSARL